MPDRSGIDNNNQSIRMKDISVMVVAEFPVYRGRDFCTEVGLASSIFGAFWFSTVLK
jgi:hypothetical protein